MKKDMEILNSKFNKKFLIFLAVFLVYISFASFDRDGPNPGSRFMLTKALVKYHSVEVPEEDMRYYNDLDYSLKDGKYYSDKAPGLSFMAAPFYFIGDLLYQKGILLPQVSSYNYQGDSNAFFLIVIFLSAISAYGVMKFYDLLELLGVSEKTSYILTLIFGFGTLYWVFVSNFFSHSITAAFITIAFYYALKFKQKKKIIYSFLAGVFLSLALSIEFLVFLIIPFFLIYLVFEKIKPIKFAILPIIIFLIPFLILLFLLGLYNWAAFGNPLSNPYQYTFFKDSLKFKNPLEEGLYAITISSWRGIFFYNPIFILIPIGVWLWSKKRLLETVVISGIVLVYVIVVSSYNYFWGGLTYGPRHLIDIIPFLMLLIFPAFEKENVKKITKGLRIPKLVYYIFVSVLVLISFFHTFLGVYVSSFPAPELNKNPVYEITLPELFQGKVDSYLLKQHTSIFILLISVSLLVLYLIYSNSRRENEI
jgi:hypothetical protein